jgi:dTDP-4-amino-4,6-dideoxygalactose transaminase
LIQVFQPSLGEEELKAIGNVFASNWLGKGQSVQAFTEGFAASLQAQPGHFLTTTCCTEGLFLAGELFGFGPEDEVLAPTVSFIAVGHAILSRGAKMVLCDVDARSLNATVDHAAACITPRTKAIYLNHYGGVPCDMDPILELCREKGIAVIEDSACAVRSFYKGKAIGTLGDMGVWSFDAMKALCAGDGGMLHFRSRDLLRKAQESLYLGLPASQKSGLDNSNSGRPAWWEIEVNGYGRRAIMNNITAAIASVQLGKLDGFLKRRREVYETYRREFATLDWLTLPPVLPEHCESSYYFFWVQTEYRDPLAKYLLEQGIYTTFRYWPLHRVEFFKYPGGGFPNADWACARTLNLPLHQALSDSDVQQVVEAVRRFGREKI